MLVCVVDGESQGKLYYSGLFALWSRCWLSVDFLGINSITLVCTEDALFEFLDIWTSYLISKPIVHSTNQSANRSVKNIVQSTNQSRILSSQQINQSANRSVNKSASRSSSQPVSQSYKSVRGCTSGGGCVLVFKRMPGESYRRRLRSLLLYLCVRCCSSWSLV